MMYLKKISILLLIILCSYFKSTAQGVGINPTGADPDASAGLDLSFSDKGMLIPRLTTTQRDAIGSPASFLMIINTTTECFEVYYSSSSSWKSMFCFGCQIPGSFSATTATNVQQSSFDANWNSSGSATTYYLDVDDNSDFSSPLTGYNNLNVGNVVTYSITGLTCNTTYYYRVRAENSCGVTSNSNTITSVTSGCTTEVTNPNTGQTWLNKNLGASQVATSSTDVLSYGDLYQWGRLADGHELRTSGTTSTTSNSDVPGHSNFILGNASLEWRSPSNLNLWQGISGTNNPCPSGFRIPTWSEWNLEQLDFVNTGGNNSAGAFGSPLKIPLAGLRNTDGNVQQTGTAGFYASSTANPAATPTAEHLYFNASTASQGLGAIAIGYSVRCIKN